MKNFNLINLFIYLLFIILFLLIIKLLFLGYKLNLNSHYDLEVSSFLSLSGGIWVTPFPSKYSSKDFDIALAILAW